MKIKNKKTIILFISMLFLLFLVAIPISNILAATIQIPSGSELGLPDPSGGVKGVLDNIMTWTLSIVGIIGVIGFIISGIQYMLASGEEDMMERAKRNMIYSIIGVVIALGALVILIAIENALNAVSF